MTEKSEKEAFSQRLKQQLAKNGWAVNSPTWLAKEFNLRFSGQAVSVQTASNWLSGNAIPSQDKLQVLSVWLNVSNQWLRFGDEQNITQSAHFLDYETISLNDFPDKFSQLTMKQKFLIYHLVEDLLANEKHE